MTDDLLTGVEAAAGLAVYGAGAVDSLAAASVRQALVTSGVTGLLTGGPAPSGSPAAPAAYPHSRELLPQLAELRAELADLDRVVLCCTGRYSLAPQAIARTLGVTLTVLDTTDPHQVRAALYGYAADPGQRTDRLRRTVVVLAGSDSNIETDSHRRACQHAFAEAGMSAAEAGRHFVVVAHPGSPLARTARDIGAVVVPADTETGGPWAALSAFGLVPAALAGVDVAELLDQADLLAPSLTAGTGNPALALGAALGAAATTGRDKVALVPDGTGIEGLGEWIEQRLAASTGKDGLGLLPVVVEDPGSAGVTGADVLTVSYGGALPPAAVPGGGVLPDVAVNGPLGAQLLAWEYATAVVGRVLDVDPADQPDVADSTRYTAAALAGGRAPQPPTFVEGAVQVHTSSGAGDLVGVLRDLIAGLSGEGYLAVMAYLDRYGESEVAEVRPALAAASGRPVTFGWGPRLLHSTGQYHKGGPRIGSFLQITGRVTADLPVPGRSYTFGTLQAAQAAGDRQALAERHRPLLHLHLTDRTEGVRQLIAAANSLQA